MIMKKKRQEFGKNKKRNEAKNINTTNKIQSGK